MKHYHQAKQITIFGIIVNVLLSILKLFFGIFGHSAALVADGIHALSDIVVDGFVLFAMKTGRRPPDQKHPYGHGRIETIFTVILSLVLLFTGGGIILNGIENILHQDAISPDFSVLIVAFISLICNEGLYRYTLKIEKRYRSAILQANAWHRRSDALSSLIVLIGVIGAMLNFHYFDAIAAIIVAIMILKIGVALGWNSLRELVDTGVDKKTCAAILKTIQQVSGVASAHQLRTRLMGGMIFVDVHIQVSPQISVSEGHYIAEQVITQLRETFKNISDVVVHTDIEDEVASDLSTHLPNREFIEKQLRVAWQLLPFYHEIMLIRLHYLNGGIIVDLIFPYAILKDIDDSFEFLQHYRQNVREVEEVAYVNIYFGDELYENQ